LKLTIYSGIFMLSVVFMLTFSLYFNEVKSLNWLFSSILSVSLFYYLFCTRDSKNFKYLKFIIFIFLVIYTYLFDMVNFLGHLRLNSMATHLSLGITFLLLIPYLKSERLLPNIHFLLLAIFFNILTERRILVFAIVCALMLSVIPKKIYRMAVYMTPPLVILLVVSLGFYFYNERLFGLRDISWYWLIFQDFSYFDNNIIEIKLNNYGKSSISDLNTLLEKNAHSMFLGSFMRFGYVGFFLSFLFWAYFMSIVLNNRYHPSIFKMNLFIAFISLAAIFNGRSIFSVDPYTISIILISYVYIKIIPNRDLSSNYYEHSKSIL